ncbi:cadherin-89D [Panulirus ornatus]|uniref:cadherin-89D n=1 Tax=Panulirus ornatus TaxID=150431 RepID=UPI003A8BB23E
MTSHTTRAALLLLLAVVQSGLSCEWGVGEEMRRFVRVREDAPVGHSVLTINMTHPALLVLQPLSQDSAGLFRVAEGPAGQGHVVVGAPLQPLMLSTSPVTKLALTCGDNQVAMQVTVYVEDVNDHPPLFMVTNITVTVDELTPVGLTILPEVRVTDADKPNTANSEVELELRTGNEGNYFKMSDRKRGSIILARSLDYDTGPKMFLLGVVAKDMGKPSLSSTSTISVIVLDADDLPPVFSYSHYSAKVAEHPGPDMGLSIHEEVLVSPSDLNAKDGDVGQNTTLHYTLVESPAADHFTLDPDTGQLFLSKHLDRENLTDNMLTLHVRAEQVDNSRRVGSSVIEVMVEDVNDNLPQFTHDVYAISIVENLPSGFSVVQVSATDPDEGLNGAFNYHVVGGGGALAVNPLSGWLTVANHNMLDREESPVINLQVCANQITPLVKFVTDSSIVKQSSRVDNEGKSKFLGGLEDEERVTKVSEEFMTDDWDVVTTKLPSFETLTPTKGQQNSSIRVTVPLWRRVAQTAHTPVAEHSSSLIPLHFRYGRQSLATYTGTRTAKENVEKEAQYDNNSTSKTTEISEKQHQQKRDPAKGHSNPNTEKKFVEEGDTWSQNNKTERSHSSPYTSPSPPAGSSTVSSIKDTYEEADMRTVEEQARPGIVYNGQVANSRLKRETYEQVQRNESTNINAKVGALNDGSQMANSFSNFESISCAKIELKLLDANDNNPVFHPSNQYQFTITEDTQEGHIIGSVLAEDIDEGDNGRVMYKIQAPGNTTRDTLREAVTVDEVQGILMLVSKLPPGQVTVFVEAFDSPSNPSETRTSLAVVTIDVKATHSWEPRFMGAPFELWVGGDAPVGTSVGQVRVVDLPGPELMFDMFHSYTEGVPFAIEESSGIVSVMSPLQQYSQPTYEFEAVVTDGTLSLATNLTIHVAPPPRPTSRRNTIIHFTIQENLAGGVVGDLLAALRAIGARIAPDPQFELVSPEARQYFALAQDATLYTVAPLDYETHHNHTLVVVSARTSDIFYIHVQVEDINDNAPQFNAVSYEGIIKENALPGTLVKILPTVNVYDDDSYVGSSYYLQLLGEAAPLFSIDSSNGHVTFVGEALDREVKEVYSLFLVAKDDGNLTSKANLTITVEDVNDNPPRFTHREPLHSAREEVEENSSRKLPDTSSLKYLADLERSLIHIPESLSIGSKVTQLTATDEDKKTNADIRYVIESEKSFSFSFPQVKNSSALHETKNFLIEAKTGSVAVAGILEPDHFYLLNVSATDGGGLSSYIRVAIAVFDVNDHTPRFERPVYNFEVIEGEYLVGEVGKVTAYDQDMGNNAKIHYQIIFDKNSTQDLAFPFRIIETSGTILATGSVDREEREVYEFSVMATDMGDPQLSSSVLVHIDIIDVNDHSPKFYGYKEVIYPPDTFMNTSFESSHGNFIPVYMALVSENASRNTFVTNIFANDSDASSSGNGILLYKLEGGEDKFAIDSKNGSIYTVGSLDYELSPEHNISVLAQDLGSPSLTATALLRVTVVDVREELTTRLFDRDEYRVLVTENNNTPLLLVDLNVSGSYAHHRMHYQLADPQMIGTVAVDSHSGEVYLIASLDREMKDKYHFKVRAIQPEQGRALEHFHQQTRDLDFLEYTVTSLPATVSRTTSPHLLLAADEHQNPLTDFSDQTQKGSETSRRVPATLSMEGLSLSGQRLETNPEITDVLEPLSQYNSEGNHDKSTSMLMDGAGKLGLDEVWVTVEVEDQNDNSPRFSPHSRPIVAAVPASAAFGHFVTRITAQDPDLGVNGEVRYEILPGEGAQDATTRFNIDPMTGQVVVMGTLEDVAGRMFGFDVRATDQQGAPNGRTAITNVFVHVLGAGRHLVVEVGATPRDVEPHLHHIQGTLTNVSGLDVRVQRITPHVDGDAAHTTATDVYVYAVDPVTQAVVDGAQLRQALRGRKGQLRSLLPSGLHLQGMRLPLSSKQGHVLQTAELAILVGAVVVFLVTVTAVACLCYKQRKSRRKPMPLPPLMTAGGVPVMPLAYPGPFGAPYTHMSDHSSADSLEAQELPHDHTQYHHDSASCPQETAHYPQDFVHYPRAAHRRHPCTHDHHSDHELQHSSRNEQVSSHTDEDDKVPACLHQAPSRKRRRGPEVNGVPQNGLSKRASSRFGTRLQEEPSSSDLDERDHAPALVTIPRPPWCCTDDRQYGVTTSRVLPTVDCSLSSSTRPHSPDSLEQPPMSRKHPHIHTIPRTQLKRERTGDQTGRGAGSSGLLPSDVTEL